MISLPVELILNIAEYLNATDRGNLRLSCKSLASAIAPIGASVHGGLHVRLVYLQNGGFEIVDTHPILPKPRILKSLRIVDHTKVVYTDYKVKTNEHMTMTLDCKPGIRPQLETEYQQWMVQKKAIVDCSKPCPKVVECHQADYPPNPCVMS
tara:strand:- start:2418 stop:2873 length:456 start_codon:yes stop_codon:yes gene_type:complete